MRRAPPEPVKPSKKNKSNSKSTKTRKTNASGEEEALEQPPPTMIFCARAKTAAYLSTLLQTLGIRSTALHSRLTQRARMNALNLFRARVVPVLVCTDVGARGLDVDDVALVVNWDVPRAPEEYTHRVGRTARAGRSGLAVSFVTERDESAVIQIEGRIRKPILYVYLFFLGNADFIFFIFIFIFIILLRCGLFYFYFWVPCRNEVEGDGATGRKGA